MAVYKHVLKLPALLAVPEDRAYLDLIGKIVDGDPLLHRLRIARLTFPQNVAQTTAPHQDHWYIRGTPATYTVWTPLGDCPMTLGGLAVLPRSHTAGFIEHRMHAEKKYAGHGLGDDQMPASAQRWVAGDFKVGDFLVFHSYTVHKALPNLTIDRMRLSTDNRYQRGGRRHRRHLQRHALQLVTTLPAVHTKTPRDKINSFPRFRPENEVRCGFVRGAQHDRIYRRR